jgi:hypothetical protein
MDTGPKRPLPDGDVQIATSTTYAAIEELNELARQRSITRAALLRDLVGRGLWDYRRERKLLESLRRAQEEVA